MPLVKNYLTNQTYWKNDDGTTRPATPDEMKVQQSDVRGGLESAGNYLRQTPIPVEESGVTTWERFVSNFLSDKTTRAMLRKHGYKVDTDAQDRIVVQKGDKEWRPVDAFGLGSGGSVGKIAKEAGLDTLDLVDEALTFIPVSAASGIAAKLGIRVGGPAAKWALSNVAKRLAGAAVMGTATAAGEAGREGLGALMSGEPGNIEPRSIAAQGIAGAAVPLALDATKEAAQRILNTGLRVMHKADRPALSIAAKAAGLTDTGEIGRAHV